MDDDKKPAWTFPLKLPRAEQIHPTIGNFLVFLACLIALIVFASLLGLLVQFAGHSLGLIEDRGTNAPDTRLRNLVLILAAILGAPFVIWRSFIAQRQADTAAQGHITDRISKAVEQLAATKTVRRVYRNEDGNPHLDERDVPIVQDLTEPNLEVRIGGIYALERISQDSGRHHVQIMEILCAFIRENARRPRIDHAATKAARAEDAEAAAIHAPPRLDIQTALTVIARRWCKRIAHERSKSYRLDLRKAEIAGAELEDAKLDRARLDGANLQMTRLTGANLQDADLRGANLQAARLYRANLQEADLWRANLQETWLYHANLQGAFLYRANLQGATVNCANLQEARLPHANLQGAMLYQANLQGATLFRANLQAACPVGANLQETNLYEANLQEARLNEANLQEAELDGANLQKAELNGANLQEAWLDGANLQSADLRDWSSARMSLRSADFTGAKHLAADAVKESFGVRSGYGTTILPEGFTPPVHWHVAENAEEDSTEHYSAYMDAYEAWLATLPDDAT